MDTHRHPLVDKTRKENGLEMSWRQQAIVDTCFEEGQFESAILNLEQLQSPSYKPSVCAYSLQKLHVILTSNRVKFARATTDIHCITSCL